MNSEFNKMGIAERLMIVSATGNRRSSCQPHCDRSARANCWTAHFPCYRHNFVLFFGIAALPHLLILVLQVLPLLMGSS